MTPPDTALPGCDLDDVPIHSAETVPIALPSAASVVLVMAIEWGCPLSVAQARLARMNFEDLS